MVCIVLHIWCALSIQTDPYDLELDMNLRKKKKKSKPFACRRSKKRRKHTRIQKPVPPGTSKLNLSALTTIVNLTDIDVIYLYAG